MTEEYVPSLEDTRVLEDEIRARFKEGVSKRALAKEFGLSRRQVDRIVQESRGRSLDQVEVMSSTGDFSSYEVLIAHANFHRRLVQAKTQQTAEEIKAMMDDFCAEVLEHLAHWVQLGKRAVFAEGGILYLVECYWNDLQPLHEQYSSFHDFAVQVTGEDYTTFRSKINIYRTFVLNEGEVKEIEERGAEQFMKVGVGKLQKAMGAVHRGEMTEERWDALTDENVQDRQFYQIMQTSVDNDEREQEFVQRGGPPSLTIDMSTGQLSYWSGDDKLSIQFGHLDVTTKDNVVREVVDKLITDAGIKRRE